MDKAGYFGGSVDVSGVSVGTEFSLGRYDKTSELIGSVTGSVGIGAPIPIEFHGGVSNSQLRKLGNVFDNFEAINKIIMEW